MPITTKLGRVVTNLEGFQPIMLLNPLVTWSCVFPLPKWLSPQD